jgi:hypothetical protein
MSLAVRISSAIQTSARSTPTISFPSSSSVNLALTLSTTPPALVDYGSKVLQGASQGVNDALAGISGLTGSLLSTVVAEVNAALAEAISTAQPLTGVLQNAAPTAIPIVTPASILPVATNAVGNAAQVLGSLLTDVQPLPTNLVNSIVSLATELGVPVVSNAGAAIGVAAGALPSAVPVANSVVDDVEAFASRLLNTVPSDAIGNVAALLNPVLPVATSVGGSGLNLVPQILQAVQLPASRVTNGNGGIVDSVVTIATAAPNGLQSGAGVPGIIGLQQPPIHLGVLGA